MEVMKTPANKQSRGQGQRADFPRLLGGNLCLDFINTVESRSGPEPIEFLRSYADVVAWGEHVGLLSGAQGGRLLKAAREFPQAATVHFEAILALRESLYHIFLSIARGEAPHREALEHLKQAYLAALRHGELARTDKGYDWQWEAPHALDRICWFVARAAVELLCSEELERVKECRGANDCGWLFLDASRNRSRRWCSMEGCGSRVKMRRRYQRTKREQSR